MILTTEAESILVLPSGTCCSWVSLVWDREPQDVLWRTLHERIRGTHTVGDRCAWTDRNRSEIVIGKLRAHLAYRR